MAELNQSPEKSSGTKVRAKRASVRVDLTAMVDLAFLLITFFIMTTTLSKPKAMKITMPADGEPAAVSDLRTMTICLGKDNKAVWYLGQAQRPLVPATVTNYTKNGLRRAISQIVAKVKAATGKSLMVVIKPSNNSVYSDLVNTLDEMNITNVNQYAIADIAREDVNLLKEKRVY